MGIVEASRSNKIRSGLSHPVIDTDGHWLESLPVLLDYIRRLGGSDAETQYLKLHDHYSTWYGLSPEQRFSRRTSRAGWWSFPADTLDRATAMMPSLMYERLDEFGIDYAIILPTHSPSNNPGLIQDSGLRRVVCRAYNVMQAEVFASCSDRMTPGAVIPTHTPDEGIEEAEYAVNELGLKVALIAGSIRRPVAAYATDGTDVRNVPYFVDSLALDSPYDYDPLWSRFAELQLSPMTHSPGGSPDRTSPTNYVHNHLGQFSSGANAFARALFLGGVTRRFPDLKFGFLEGGVGWARVLCSDLAAHWEKRSRDAMLAHLRPANLDLDRLRQLFESYGGSWLAGRADELLANLDFKYPGVTVDELTNREGDVSDDFAAVNVHSKAEVVSEFARNFYFGCESDDPVTCLAFDPRFGPNLKPLFSSDVSHFDVIHMTDVLEEAYELVEHGFINEQEFRQFTFSNTVELHAGANPDFFKGTVVESAVQEELARSSNQPSQ